MTTLLTRLMTMLRDWLAWTGIDPRLTPAHGWLLPDPHTFLLRQRPVRVTVTSARLR